MTPQLRFPEFTDVWQVKKLGEIVDIVDGDRGVNYPKQTDFTKAGYCLFLNASNVTKSGFDFKEKQFISTEKDKALNKGKLSREDVVLTTRGTVGNFAYYSDEVPYDQVRINSGMVLLRAGSDVAPGYLHSSSSYFDKQIKSIAFGSAQPQLTVGAIKKLKLPMPSKPEQEKIADFLTAVDERIAVGEKKLELLETYKRGVMQKIFSQQIRFKDENGNDYPEWEEKKLGDIAKKENSPISANEIVGRSGKYKVYGASGLLQTLDSYNQGESYTAIVKDGAGVGRLMWCEAESSVLGTLNIIKPKLDGSSKFLHYLLHTINFQRYSIGSTIPHVYFSDYSKHKLVVPENIEEQQKIANFLTTLDDKIKLEEAKLASSKEFKKALLQRMFV